MSPIDIQVIRSKGQGQRSCQFTSPCATDISRMLCLRSFKLGRYTVFDEYLTPNDIQFSRSNVSVEGQAYFLYVGEGGISVLQTAIFIRSIAMR